MVENYDSKYGINSSSKSVTSFHSQRRMFAIKDSILYLAPENVSYSHAKWFELKGWISPKDDSFMNTLTRGYFDLTGIYFYKGYDFSLDTSCENEMLKFISSLIEKASLDTSLNLFGGKIKKRSWF